MKRLFLFLGAIVYSSLQAQEPLVQQYGNMITPTDLKEYLSILASDAMEGRETGTRGQKMAAAFISAHFEEIGLKAPVDGSYYQFFDLYKTGPGEIYIKSGQKRFSNFKDVVFRGSSNTNGEVSLPLVYLGAGRAEDFALLDVKDKAVLIRIEGDRLYNLQEVARAREKGATLVLLWNTNSNEDFQQSATQAKQYRYSGLNITKPKLENNGGIPIFTVSTTAVEAILAQPAARLKTLAAEDPRKKALKKVKPVTISYKTTIDIIPVKTANVLGYLEGTDKKDELIVVTAHYDHIGRRDSGTGDLINNGADDDGSGSVTVMELAKIFAEAKRDGNGPRRSMLFMTVTGEEKGLLGSDYYVQHPVFPLKNTVVDLNVDMVGRRDPQHKDSAPYVYVIGSDKLSAELHALSERMNNTYSKIIFDYTYNDENHPTRLYYRSDHWNFAKNNIPIIFYFDGIHEDYHKPSDEVDKIEFDLLAKRAQSMFYAAWEIANQENRIAVDKEKLKEVAPGK